MIELRYLISSSDANNQYIHTQPYKRLQYRYMLPLDPNGPRSEITFAPYKRWSEWFDIPMIVQGEVYANDPTPEYNQEYVETVSNVQGVVY